MLHVSYVILLFCACATRVKGVHHPAQEWEPEARAAKVRALVGEMLVVDGPEVALDTLGRLCTVLNIKPGQPYEQETEPS